MKNFRSFEWRALPIITKNLVSRLCILQCQEDDAWLERWIPLIQRKSIGIAIMEIGCGKGQDTAFLQGYGLKVIAFDISSAQIELARTKVPCADFLVQDLRDPFPVDRTGVVISSLSLHYFSWNETLDIIDRIRTVLQPGGIFICRLNSTNDVNFGARGHTKIDDNFYMVHGEPKRFFDHASILKAFTGWKVLHIEEKETYRFILPKTVWEVVLEV